MSQANLFLYLLLTFFLISLQNIKAQKHNSIDLCKGKLLG